MNNININNINRLTRAPCFISPYHYRLDWLMWFAAFQKYQQNPWLVGILDIKTQLVFYLTKVRLLPCLVKAVTITKALKMKFYKKNHLFVFLLIA